MKTQMPPRSRRPGGYIFALKTSILYAVRIKSLDWRCKVTPETLQLARRKLGLNLSEMAIGLKTPYRTYQDWEAGRRPMPGIVDVAVAGLLHRDELFMDRIKNTYLKK